MLHFDGDRYRLLGVVHHAQPCASSVVEPIRRRTGLARHRVRLGNPFHRRDRGEQRSPIGRGPFWHKDYFDRFIRDEGHLARTIDYVETQPGESWLGLNGQLMVMEFGSQTRMSARDARGPEDA